MTTVEYAADEVEDLARGVGVLRDLDRTTREVPLSELMNGATELLPVVEPPTPRRSRLRAFGRRLVDWMRAVLARVEAESQELERAVSWLLGGPRPPRATKTWWNRYRYRPRHHVRTYVYGRDRSTSEFSRVVQSRSREAEPEGELRFHNGDDVVPWIIRMIEFLRWEQETLHPPVGRHLA